MIATIPKLICYPPAPMNGGPLDSAPAKVGAWVWQPKIDDRRVAIHTATRTVWNQYGQLSVAHRDLFKFEAALDTLERLSFAAEWLDCGLMEYRHDMMRGSIVVLDMIDAALPFDERRLRLELMFTELPWATELAGTSYANQHVFLIPQVTGEAQGRALYAQLKEQNAKLGRAFYEGVVAKRADSLYPMFQRPKQKFANWVKSRFDQ